MKKELIVTSVIGAALVSMASGAASSFGTLNPGTGANVTVVDSTGTLIASGSGYAAVGGFSIDEAAIGSASNTALADAFEAYASTTFGGAAIGNAQGIASAAGINDPISASLSGNGTNPVYYVFGNGTTLRDSTEWAVVRDAGSVFPTETGGPVPISFDTNIGEVAAGDVIAGSLIAPVVSPELVGQAPDAGGTIQLVPEASTVMLSLLGLGLIFRRRR